MLVFPQWRRELPEEACRTPRWMPAERFAPYLARPIALPPLPPQIDDEDSSGGSSPERNTSEGEGESCGWRGCGARYPSIARLSAHVARVHALAHSDGLFYCGWKGCGRPQRGFNARYKMLVHVRTHTNERPHTCNQCHKSFSRAENLKIHLRSHSGEKPYICPYEGCGKAYSNSSDRFKHTRTHTVDKPYCCKVPGCNKRYTDPSSLRKHVKTYKHFATEEAAKRESSDEVHSSEAFSPLRESNSTYTHLESVSPLHGRLAYSPPRPTLSPTTPYNSVLSLSEPAMPSIAYSSHSQMPYFPPVEPMYSLRVPHPEMSYLEYTQMYEHAYRNYYTNNAHYPVLRPTVIEKVFNYEEKPQIDDVIMVEEKEEPKYAPVEEMPLNLCSKRLECKPIEELVRRTDLPLDLSTKS
ncbi:zinc finger protein GLIS2-like [Pectinophora gossypiella]|uniref:C2H2-type domain-containing protein n=2 Tax=Pectinophora gossypiella TaxID=13191 RepID=A0A1E1WEQ1_PECGO|nr:zinc finger protein GLIS2-like [Pectinophora gossypiella]